MSENNSRVSYVDVPLQSRDRSTPPPSGKTMNILIFDCIAMLMTHITTSAVFYSFDIHVSSFVRM